MEEEFEDTFDDVNPQLAQLTNEFEERQKKIVDSFQFLDANIERQQESIAEARTETDDIYKNLIDTYRRAGDTRSKAVKQKLADYRDSIEQRVAIAQDQVLAGIPFLGVDLLGALTGVQMDNTRKEQFLTSLINEANVTRDMATQFRADKREEEARLAEQAVADKTKVAELGLQRSQAMQKFDQQELDNEFTAFKLETERLKELNEITASQQKSLIKIKEDMDKLRKAKGDLAENLAAAANHRSERIAAEGAVELIDAELNDLRREAQERQNSRVTIRTAIDQNITDTDLRKDLLLDIAAKPSSSGIVSTQQVMDAYNATTGQGGVTPDATAMTRLVTSVMNRFDSVEADDRSRLSNMDDQRQEASKRANSLITDQEFQVYDRMLVELMEDGVIAEITGDKSSIELLPNALPDKLLPYFKEVLPTVGGTREITLSTSSSERHVNPKDKAKSLLP